MQIDAIFPDWPAPAHVRALMTTRAGGASSAPYDGFNVGDHVGDNPDTVANNRALLASATDARPRWLKQVHGVEVVEAETSTDGAIADAAVSRTPKLACAVMTADCLPVLLTTSNGDVVAAAHAGWRGLCDGVLESTVKAMGVSADQVIAWLGAAIGPAAFEVGDDVRSAFVGRDPDIASAFRSGPKEGKWMADLYAIAHSRLSRVGVRSIYGGGLCTYSEPERFYSYRRDGATGRMVAMIWLAEATRG